MADELNTFLKILLGENIQELAGIKKRVCADFDNFCSRLQNVGQKVSSTFDQALQKGEWFLNAYYQQMAKNGWYISKNMIFVKTNEAIKLYASGKEAEADEILMGYYRDEKDKILKNACIVCPERAPILRDAFKAHDDGQYNLSVPVIIMQSEGLGFEIFGVSIFEKGKIRKELSRADSKIQEDTFERLICSLFLKNNLLQSHYNPNSLSAPSVCRHGVAHGRQTDYGRELNSYKAISLLNFLCELTYLSNKCKNESNGQ
jgi:hypothetical protein